MSKFFGVNDLLSSLTFAGDSSSAVLNSEFIFSVFCVDVYDDCVVRS